jgi:putative intracellular protease/amidase
MRVDVSSLRGGQIPIEPDSFRWFIACAQDRRYLGDPELQRQTQQSIPLSAVDFKLYDIIFLSGGWGAAYDLAQSEALGEGITQAWASGAVIGGVCHGPLGLLQARDETGKPLVEGRKLTAVTDAQVRQLGITFTPKHPEREMRAAGGRFEAETKLLDIFSQHVVVDGRLVTGQNQNAGVATAQEMMRAAGGKAQ